MSINPLGGVILNLWYLMIDVFACSVKLSSFEWYQLQKVNGSLNAQCGHLNGDYCVLSANELLKLLILFLHTVPYNFLICTPFQISAIINLVQPFLLFMFTG